jgi:hypothetical protein
MTTTQTSRNIRRNHVAATVDHDGQRLGHVVVRGTRFAATRKHGQAGVDIRKMATFKSLAAAVKWIEAAA